MKSLKNSNKKKQIETQIGPVSQRCERDTVYSRRSTAIFLTQFLAYEDNVDSMINRTI